MSQNLSEYFSFGEKKLVLLFQIQHPSYINTKSFYILRPTNETSFVLFYRNQSLHQDYKECATRFIALAPVGNKDKEKWVYACSVQPISKMRMTELLQSTTDETACPYNPSLLKQHQPGKVVTVSEWWLVIFFVQRQIDLFLCFVFMMSSSLMTGYRKWSILLQHGPEWRWWTTREEKTKGWRRIWEEKERHWSWFVMSDTTLFFVFK